MDGGFDRLTPVAEARASLRECCHPHGRVETCPVAEGDGRVLAAPVVADTDVPAAATATVNGYALQARGTFDAGDRSPVTLAVTGDAVGRGLARPVRAGESVPEGADAVLPAAHAVAEDDTVLVYDSVAVGENVVAAGTDAAAETRLFDAGTRLDPAALALCRRAGVRELDVVALPQVTLAVMASSGGGGDSDEANPFLGRLVSRWGGTPTSAGGLREALGGPIDADIVVVVGEPAVAAGETAADVVADLGALRVHGIAAVPGRAVGIGHVEDTPVLLVPSRSDSCLVGAVQFLRPALSWLVGAEPERLPATRARLAAKLPSAPGERTFRPVTLSDEGDELPAATPVRTGGTLSRLVGADGWVTVPEASEGLPAGRAVAVQHWARPV